MLRVLLVLGLVIALTIPAVIMNSNLELCYRAEKRALIADGLSIDSPNPELDKYLIRLLKMSGYVVNYVNGSKVNLELYSELTRYSLIILRVHGGKAVYKTPNGLSMINGLFTGIKWSNKYEYLRRLWLATRAFPYGSNKAYLAVLPRFFDVMLRGRFSDGSVIVVASCYSLYTLDIAKVLAKKGLKMFRYL